ncbi:alcohol dehydrogenase catalytic domain-containing protein [Streptomyces sp. NPDC046805]|uniref:alcohol dehydrogenase catalytic domain-containing protein n=1 Tax=Streptomyces sp. NPDC046805 TaxID=3155134 RepID=UPI0033D25A9A
MELDPPKPDEVLIKPAASGLCHSPDHLDPGDISLPFAPVLGGHEGAGVVVEVGDGVVGVAGAIMSCRRSCPRAVSAGGTLSASRT